MSEEKPRFKVTDRRLFNPDGTPRDIEREAEATTDNNNATAGDAAATTGTETAAARPDATSAGAPAATTTTAPASEGARREPSSSPAAATASESRAAAPPVAAAPNASATNAAAGVEEDPTAFANLVMFIASPAAAAMGMTEHPGLAPGELDLPLAKHCIDLLGTLQQKTHGHLGTQEGQILEGLLAELRMQYISLTSTQRPPARGFTGGDITGGR
ncbi:MAG: hypothetical protein QOG71_1848 [Pyrinomonadaceae bacterium]|nr:hypothetical protein [Pyrinomonadaceae bacterium]